jgi:uncharacterized protein (DUF2062 family)
MLFRRREKTSHIERARIWVWPRVSWRRSALYYAKRILRLSATPYAIAVGCAIGAFASFTPFVGLHFAISIALAWLVRGNIIAAAIGTAVGNPLTFPLIWTSTYQLGHAILRGEQAVQLPQFDRLFSLEFSIDALWRSIQTLWRLIQTLWPMIKTMSVGSLPLGILAGLVVYAIVYKSVAAYQANRRKRLQRHRAAHRRPAKKPVHSQA